MGSRQHVRPSRRIGDIEIIIPPNRGSARGLITRFAMRHLADPRLDSLVSTLNGGGIVRQFGGVKMCRGLGVSVSL